MCSCSWGAARQSATTWARVAWGPALGQPQWVWRGRAGPACCTPATRERPAPRVVPRLPAACVEFRAAPGRRVMRKVGGPLVLGAAPARRANLIRSNCIWRAEWASKKRSIIFGAHRGAKGPRIHGGSGQWGAPLPLAGPPGARGADQRTASGRQLAPVDWRPNGGGLGVEVEVEVPQLVGAAPAGVGD